MPQILQDWLGTRLGIAIDLTPEKFGPNTKDGKLLAKLLYSYGVIPLHVFDQIQESNNYHNCYENLLVLKPWLNYIGVVDDDSTLQSMASADGSAAISIFYAVYLNLNAKDRLHYFSAQKERRFSEDACGGRFKVDWVPETQVLNASGDSLSKFDARFHANRDVIKWHKEKCKQIVETIKKTKEKFQKSARKEKKNLGPLTSRHATSQPLDKRQLEAEETMEKINAFEKKHPYRSPDMDYSKLMELKNAVEMQPCAAPNFSEGRIMIGNLKRRKKGETYAKNFQERMEHLVLDEHWKELTENQDREFQNAVCATLLKQSQYEKQMACKLHLIRNQKTNLAENRRKIECLKMTQRERDYESLVQEKVETRGEDWEEEEFEKERIRELHRRMYDERVRLRRERIWRESQKICDALIDIAIRVSEMRDLNYCQVPKAFMKDLKELFFKDLPIFDILEHFEPIYEEDVGEEEGPPCEDCNEIEAMKNEEAERQKILDECDFNDYIHLLGPWMSELFFPDGSETEVKHLVLGYVVHKLLECKYPSPKTPTPPDIKPMRPRVVVQGLSDQTACAMLTDLMEACGVLVVRVDDAINFVLAAYKEEMSVVRDVDESFLNVTANALTRRETVEKEKEVRKKIQLLKKEPAEDVPPEEEELTILDKETQTPRMIPEDDPLLSPNAEIGKLAFEALGAGDPVPDPVIASAVVAYLVSHQEDYEGWALLNYPLLYSQASDLEYRLTGYRTLPVLDEMDSLEEVEGFRYRGPWSGVWNADEFAENRSSRLVPKPDFGAPPPEIPKTYFDLFIRVRRSGDPPRRWSSESQGPFLLEEFYSEQEILVDLDYQNFNFQAVKDVAKTILEKSNQEEGRSSDLPPRKSLEIFGSVLLELEEKYNPTKKKNPKEKEKEKPTPEAPKKAAKEQSVTLSLLPCREREEEAGDQKTPEAPPPKPGDLDWEWASGPQSEAILLALAGIWENMEAVYVEDFKGVFFCLRVHRCNACSYMASVKDSSARTLKKPNDKQKILGDFQQMFNDVDEDLRPDVDVKCELHVRVSELEEALTSIIDQIKAEVSKSNRKVYEDGWVAEEMANLVNVFLTALQLEADRCVDSCQVIMDYYLSLQQRIPEERPLGKVVVAKLQVKDRKYSIVSSANKSGSSVMHTPRNSDLRRNNRALMEQGSKVGKTRSWTEKKRRSTEGGFLEGAAEVIAEILTGLSLPEDSSTPFHNFFLDTVHSITNEVKTILEGCISETKKGDKGPPKNLKKGSDAKIPANGNLVAEWTTALENELSRFLFRSRLILARGIFDVNEFLTTMLNFVSSLNESLTEVYLKEINSISECCKVFRCAIEEEIRIQPQLLLEDERFVVNDAVLLFPTPEKPTGKKEEEENFLEDNFTLEQLSVLCHKLQSVAPNGEIIRQSFLYILEDLRMLPGEVEGLSLFPKSWNSLEPEDLADILTEVYQNLEIVHWKDFIIHALNLPFPKDTEILWMRSSFRKYDPLATELITRENYDRICFWFQMDLDHYLSVERKEKAKDLLYTLYQVDEFQTNYSAILLAFCKDEDPVGGFLKALALAMGREITLGEDSEEIVSLPGEDQNFGSGFLAEDDRSSFKKSHCCPTSSTEVIPKCIPREKIVRCQCGDFQKSLSGETTTTEELQGVSYPEGEGEGRSVFELSFASPETAVPPGILSSILTASFPSLPQMSILLDCKQTFQETLNSIYDGLEASPKGVRVHKLIKHRFVDRLLRGTNKFKSVPLTAIARSMSNARRATGGASCFPDKPNCNASCLK